MMMSEILSRFSFFISVLLIIAFPADISANSILEYNKKINYIVRVYSQSGEKINNAWVNVTFNYTNSLSFHEPIKYLNFKNRGDHVYFAEMDEVYATLNNIELYIFSEDYEIFKLKTKKLNNDVTVRLHPKK